MQILHRFYNLEFNVELKNRSDVEFALEKFNELWKDSVEVSKQCVDTIENKTWVRSDITPYEMYVKFLYEYFKEEINDDKYGDNDSTGLLPDGFKPLQYQKDAVLQAKRILEKHGGIFISDVVGLGKTYICALLAQELDMKKLILCPPILIEYWEDVMREFGVRGVKVESIGKIDKLADNGTKGYGYVFIDESHKFRNSDTESYKYLHQICVGKKVILISATPQNNYNTDIANQLYLFQTKNKSTIPTVRNLEAFFDGLRKKSKIYGKDTNEYKTVIKEISEEIRDKVLREVMIRRTRTEIQNNYSEDLKTHKLEFPFLSNPIRLFYEFDNETEKVFEKTIESITNISYAIYRPLTYVKEGALTPEQKSLLIGQKNMGGFMKGNLVKRLESSKHAFQMTLIRFIESHEKFINMYNSGAVLVSDKLKIDEFLNRSDIDELIDTEENSKKFIFKSELFEQSFITDLETDLKILQELLKLWINLTTDCKLSYFLKELEMRKELNKNKIIIFTESKETADYLYETIKKYITNNIIEFTGSMSDSFKNDIRANFDPNYPEDKQKNDYRILVTTDVLAEGMNLHRSNVIINYDLPWNPTKVMQRVGRINRVGSKHTELYVFNFFPTSKSNGYISLEQNIINKIQMFHTMLGEDSKFLTDDEVVQTHELFKKMTNLKLENDEEITSELTYLKLIRDIRDKEPELFQKIQEYPKKIKIGRDNLNIETDELVTFFRRGYLKKFYATNNDTTEEITFEQAIDKIKAGKEEKAKKISKDYYEFLTKNKEEFKLFEDEQKSSEVIIHNKKGTSNAKNIIKVLKECLKMQGKFTDIEIDVIYKIINLLESGELTSRIVKEGNKMIKSMVNLNDAVKFFKNFERIIPVEYIEYEDKNVEIKDNKKEITEIIMSEYFMK